MAANRREEDNRLSTLGSAGAACPACGANTLTRPGAGELCRVCGWPDDAASRRDPDVQSAAGESLNEARANVERFGVAFPPAEAGGS